MAGSRVLIAFVGFLVGTLIVSVSIQPTLASETEPYDDQVWTNSTATFYGGTDGSGTMGGACGYGNMNKTGYGLQTAALSTALFNSGVSCGACFELTCRLNETRWCYADAGSITITATNFCPPNPNRTKDGWCNLPRTHFDLSYKMFTSLAKAVAGIIPVNYRRVACVKTGGVRFTLNGNPWFNLVLIYNVAGVGNVVKAEMKGNGTSYFNMKRNWGQNWELSETLVNQTLSFRLTLAFGDVREFRGVAPPTWQFQQTWEHPTNFAASLTAS